MPIHSSGHPKLEQPWLPSLFPRERLFSQLDERLGHPCGWISGPSGAGKTALMAHYLERRDLNGAWFRLDEGDGNPAELFHWLGTLGRGLLREGASLPQWRPEYGGVPQRYARHFFSALADGLAAPALLVLDDYHRLPMEAPIHDLLAQVLERLTPRLRIWILSRNGPPAGFARLRSHGLLAELPSAWLPLDADEALELHRQNCPEQVDPQRVRRVMQRTGGWVVATVTMLRCDAAGQLEPGERESGLFDLLAGEILAEFGDEMAGLLTRSAFLPYMTPALLERFTGSSDVIDAVDGLARRGHFTVLSRGEPPLYEYHDLFRDFLLQRAERTFGTQGLAHLRAEAADALEPEAWEPALEAWLALGAWDRAARLLSANAPALLQQGRHSTLAGWLDAAPEAHPMLTYWRGEALLAGDALGARRAFESAFERLFRAGTTGPAYLAWSGAALATYMARESYRDAAGWLARLHELQAAGPPPDDPQIMARLAPAAYGLMITGLPDHRELPLWEERLLELVRQPLPLDLRLLVGSMLLHRNVWFVGDYGKARLVLDLLHPLLESSRQPVAPLQRCMWLTMLCGHHFWYSTDRKAAVAALDEVRRLVTEHGLVMWEYPLRLMTAYLHLAAGETVRAAATLDQIAAWLHPAWTIEQTHFHVLCAWLALVREETGPAAEHLAAAHRLDAGTGFPHNRGWAGILESRVRLHRGDAAGALRVAARTRCLLKRIGSYNILTACRLNSADLALKLGRRERAAALLRGALSGCRAQRYRRLPGLLPTVAARLCGFALERGIEPEAAGDLVRAYGLRAGGEAGRPMRWPWQLRIHTLGRFEIWVDGALLEFTRKSPAAPLVMLKALLVMGAWQVPQEGLIDLLWPDSDGDEAMARFDTTLHRLRRLLTVPGLIRVANGLVSLDPERCWADCLALEEVDGDPVEEARRALALYQGEFLPADSRQPWIHGAREHLHRRFLGLVEAGSAELERRGDRQAVEELRRGINRRISPSGL